MENLTELQGQEDFVARKDGICLVKAAGIKLQAVVLISVEVSEGRSRFLRFNSVLGSVSDLVWVEFAMES